jgi:hypothetical protein
MIDKLKKALKKIERLTKSEQQIMAQLILDEINWDQTLTNSQQQLAYLSQEALEEYKAGKAKPLQF